MKQSKKTTRILGLSFSQESRAGQGEDNSIVCFSSRAITVLASLDGCGGTGARRYPEMGNESSARIASRAVRLAIANWFSAPENGFETNGLQNIPAKRIALSLKQVIDAHLGEVKKRIVETNAAIKNKLSQTLPTTLSMAILEPVGQIARCVFVWAGDSRGYLLSSSGLRQITEDDVAGGVDPDDLSCDGIMSQVVSASGAYSFHTREVVISEPAMVITATDGCFAYFATPMDFEAMLLKILQEAHDFESWRQLLIDRLGEIAADDYSMQIACWGYRDFRDIQQSMKLRLQVFNEEYGKPLATLQQNQDTIGILALWRKYRSYYLYSGDTE